jgi:hypothetical protein
VLPINLISIIPWPYRYGALILLAGALYLTGRIQGAAAEQQAHEAQQAQVLIRYVERVKTIQAGDQAIATAFEKGRASQLAEMAKLERQLDEALSLQPEISLAQCRLSDRSLGLLNRARSGGVAADPGVPQNPVPDAAPTPRREPSDFGPAGPQRREALLRMQGQAQGAS